MHSLAEKSRPAATTRPVALAVEDDAFERLRLSTLLERLGFEVLQAADGAEALAILAIRSADVVVTDWQLPGLSGIDLCRALRGIDPERRPYTMLVTARGEVEDLVAGLDAGADDFLTKPYRAEELSARLRCGQRLRERQLALLQRTGMLEQALRHQGLNRELLDADLGAAARLQQHLLQRANRPVAGLDLGYLFRPARQVGGDVFGVAAQVGRRASFFHIDATGHGIAAALHGFAIATALLGLGGEAAEFDDPAAWAAEFNQRTLEVGAQLGCSLVVGWLDLHSGAGRLCQAGHPHPLLLSPGGALRKLGAGGLPVGALDGARYVSTDFEVGPGERLVLCSDGVTDCVDPHGRPFGQERLEDVLRSAADGDAGETARVVGLAVDRWRCTAAHDDDLSLLVLAPGRMA